MSSQIIEGITIFGPAVSKPLHNPLQEPDPTDICLVA
jgi:hypothetical protein